MSISAQGSSNPTHPGQNGSTGPGFNNMNGHPAAGQTQVQAGSGMAVDMGVGHGHNEDAEQAKVRAEVESLLLSLSQDLYEMEVCAGDVAAGMEGAVPGYLAKINAGFANLSALSRQMTDSVPRQVVENVDANRNPHTYTRTTLSRATGENQYALGRMLGLETFRRQLHDALAADFPQIPLPERRHNPDTVADHVVASATRALDGVAGPRVKEEVNNGTTNSTPANGDGP